METKGKLSSYVKTPLIFVQESFTSNFELLKQVYRKAFDLEWVTEDFFERIKQREEVFPTGIQLETLGAAIPHTDAECVKQEFVAVITNKSPVTFSSMEDKSQKVRADIVFVLGLNQPHTQLEMLQSLIEVLQDQPVLDQILSATDSDELLAVIKKNNL